jgi:outer membrane protein OmpA-like peptidoglycan-associated protein
LSKQFLLSAAVLSLSLIACAPHVPLRVLTQSSMTGVRLDEVIRVKCEVSSSVTPVFEFNSTELSADAKVTLSTIATCFTSGPLGARGLKLVGFTDPRGTAASNYELGLERAQAVSTYLEHQGMKHAQLNVSSRGEEGASPDAARWPADRIVDLSVVN